MLNPKSLKFFLGIATLPLLILLGVGEVNADTSFKKDVAPFFEAGKIVLG